MISLGEFSAILIIIPNITQNLAKKKEEIEKNTYKVMF